MSRKKSVDQPSVKSIKGFDGNLQCRGFQFEVGKTYEHKGDVVACGSGFHACPVEHHPLSVFKYYAPAGNRFFEVTQGGQSSAEGTKLASATITIDFELTIGDLVKRAWDYVWSKATKTDEAHVTIDRGAALSTGDYGAALSTGYCGAASSTGDYGAASSTGDYGAAMASGFGGKVMGADGNALFAVERNGRYEIISVASGIVGRDGIKDGVWYYCRNGALVEC